MKDEYLHRLVGVRVFPVQGEAVGAVKSQIDAHRPKGDEDWMEMCPQGVEYWSNAGKPWQNNVTIDDGLLRINRRCKRRYALARCNV